MPTYLEYTTVKDTREIYLAGVKTTDDPLVLQQIREASRQINLAANRQFHPLIQTRMFDTPSGAWLRLTNADLLAITTLLNGDATAISASQYLLLPANLYPKWGIQLKPSSGLAWQTNADGESLQAISLTGTWGYHANYADAWAASGAVLTSAVADTATTSIALTSGVLKAGQLLKIDGEFLYLSALSGATATVVRGVNGSTAAAHSNGATVYVWTVDDALSGLCRRAAAALYKLRANPIGETIVIDGQSYVTPKDVFRWIQDQINAMGLRRM